MLTEPLLTLQAQTNFYQYLPAILLALALLEGNEVLSPSYLYILGIIITVARLSHTGQLFFPDQIPMPFRMAGFLTTALFLLATSTLLILLGLQVLAPLHHPLHVPLLTERHLCMVLCCLRLWVWRSGNPHGPSGARGGRIRVADCAGSNVRQRMANASCLPTT